MTTDVVRFKVVEVDELLEDKEGKPVVSPVMIWTGVLPGSTSAMTAHDVAQDVLALLKDHYQITDVDIDFRESLYTHVVGPLLFEPIHNWDPLVEVLGPLTPALGLCISTRARPDAQATMALYLVEGNGSGGLLGLSCCHALIPPTMANLNYTHHPSGPPKNVIMLSQRALAGVVDSIKDEIAGHGIMSVVWKQEIKEFKEREKGTNAAAVKIAIKEQMAIQGLLGQVEEARDVLKALLHKVNRHWMKLDNCILGPIIYSPAIRLGVGEQRFTEDWGIFQVDQTKLGDGFKGNVIDLGVF
ncbi:hypothetical protein FRC06_006461 [Ceratobasidium sp. 370]|nr:hypothetical protein FRC06_006461 [Ceratobasidium sp. 370]